MDQILNDLQNLFREVFQDDGLSINRHTSANDIDDWDSLMHVNLIVNVEKSFDVRFSSSEVAKLNDVEELAGLIIQKQSCAAG